MINKPFTRAERVSNKIRFFLSDILSKKINDKRLSDVTITDVKMSKDLKDAYIYFCLYGDQREINKKVKKAEQGFESALGFLRTKMAKELKLRFVPNLRFYYDKLFDNAAHLNEIFQKDN